MYRYSQLKTPEQLKSHAIQVLLRVPEVLLHLSDTGHTNTIKWMMQKGADQTRALGKKLTNKATIGMPFWKPTATVLILCFFYDGSPILTFPSWNLRSLREKKGKGGQDRLAGSADRCWKDKEAITLTDRPRFRLSITNDSNRSHNQPINPSSPKPADYGGRIAADCDSASEADSFPDGDV